jgi:hypothetical protein
MVLTRTRAAGALAVVILTSAACTGGTGGSQPPGGLAGPAAGPTVGTTVEWPVTRCGTFSGHGCAPTSGRVDVTRPTFSHPTKITNPLFPISALHSVVLLGKVEGKPFRSETTLIPGTHTATVDGKPVQVLISQYTAYLGGRIDEVAVDRYAQADDGSVWYFGEDVFDYRNGAAAVTEGTWLAGRDGPPAMIMPARPQVSDVFRAENITGVVFEEITVKAVDRQVKGPSGPVNGAVTMQELHLDGSVSDKIFAPGYGEFDTSSNGETEALALAVPADHIDGPMPPELRLMSTSAWGILENARLADWEAAAPTLVRLDGLWKTLAAKNYPPGVAARITQSLQTLNGAVTTKNTAGTSQAAVDLGQSALDLELLYRGDVEVDRFHQHTQQLRVHAAARDLAGVTGEVAALEWVRDRLASGISETQRGELDADLRALRTAASAGNVAATADIAARAAARLRRT